MITLDSFKIDSADRILTEAALVQAGSIVDATQLQVETRRKMREAFEQSEEQRKAAGREEAARNQAIRDARDKALAEGLAAVADQAREAGVTVEIEDKALVARRHGESVRGRWWPDKRPTIRDGSIPCCSASAWLERLLR